MKKKRNVKKYAKIIDEIKDQILFIVEDDLFIMGKDFMRFRFRTSDNLPYNTQIDVALCVILLNSVFTHRLNYKIVFIKIVIIFMKTN